MTQCIRSELLTERLKSKTTKRLSCAKSLKGHRFQLMCKIIQKSQLCWHGHKQVVADRQMFFGGRPTMCWGPITHQSNTNSLFAHSDTNMLMGFTSSTRHPRQWLGRSVSCSFELAHLRCLQGCFNFVIVMIHDT